MAASKHTQTKIALEGKVRTITGKQVKHIRKAGNIPATVYGRDFAAQSIEIPYLDFNRVYRTARETGIVYLKIDTTEHPTLISDVQRHPLFENILHVDFRRIDLTKKIETHVPVKLIGTSEAVSQKGAVVLAQANELMIEALPANIPQVIEVDISPLKDIGHEITVKDLPVSADYTINEEADKVIVSAIAHKEESVIPETTMATPEVITEKAPEEGAAAEAPEEKKA